MKVKSLQFGKAMSAALFVLLLVVVGSKNALAQTQVATLQHEGSISAFYGQNAFVQAHAAAIDGDTITLSSGNFDACNITKAITLHGAGCVSDTLGITPTTVSGDFNINIPNDSLFLTVEGINFSSTWIRYYNTLYHAKFVRCKFGEHFINYGYSNLYEVQFINCLIGDITIRSSNDSVIFINCVVHWFRNVTNAVLAFNSIIIINADFNHNNMYLYNCIVWNADHITGAYASNCIQVGSVFPLSVQTVDCMTVDSSFDVFKNWNGFALDADFSLKDEIATSFLGNDGTEVGIYGGMMPYDPRPSYLILYRCNVAGHTTIDNKLSVDVEVITGD